MHLRSVLKDSPVWDALVAAWQGGAVLAGTAAGAMVLCDPMVDPRGGALHGRARPHRADRRGAPPRRLVRRQGDSARSRSRPQGVPVVGIDERTALIREPDGSLAGVGRR